MFSAKDYAYNVNFKYYENCKNWLIDNTLAAVDNYFADKPMFSSEDDVFYTILDDYTLNTNTCSCSPITIYVGIDQPNNINNKEPLKKRLFKKPNPLIKNMHLPLEKIKEGIFNQLTGILDSSCLILNNNNNIEIWKSEILDDNIKTSLHFKIIIGFLFDTDNNKLVYYDKKYTNIIVQDINLIESNFNKKNNKTNSNYANYSLILKNIYLQQVDKKELPALLFETILYNVPDEYFEGDINNENLLKIINFIKNYDLKNFKTIDEYDDAFISNTSSFSVFYAKHIIKIIEKSIKAMQKNN